MFFLDQSNFREWGVGRVGSETKPVACSDPRLPTPECVPINVFNRGSWGSGVGRRRQTRALLRLPAPGSRLPFLLPVESPRATRAETARARTSPRARGSGRDPTRG